MSAAAYRRVVRRETHSPRTAAAIVAAVLLIVLAGYVGIELVLALAGQPPVLVGPDAAGGWLVALPTLQPAAAVIAGGVGVALVGVVFLVLAIAPGRLAKHEMTQDDRAVIVDNGVIAAALAQHVSDWTGIARDDVTVGVGHRRADVTVRPGYGIPLDATQVQRLADAELANYRLVPDIRTRVRVVTLEESDRNR